MGLVSPYTHAGPRISKKDRRGKLGHYSCCCLCPAGHSLSAIVRSLDLPLPNFSCLCKARGSLKARSHFALAPGKTPEAFHPVQRLWRVKRGCVLFVQRPVVCPSSPVIPCPLFFQRAAALYVCRNATVLSTCSPRESICPVLRRRANRLAFCRFLALKSLTTNHLAFQS